MVAYTKPQQANKEESKRLRVEGDQIKFINNNNNNNNNSNIYRGRPQSLKSTFHEGPLI